MGRAIRTGRHDRGTAKSMLVRATILLGVRDSDHRDCRPRAACVFYSRNDPRCWQSRELPIHNPGRGLACMRYGAAGRPLFAARRIRSIRSLIHRDTDTARQRNTRRDGRNTISPSNAVYCRRSGATSNLVGMVIKSHGRSSFCARAYWVGLTPARICRLVPGQYLVGESQSGVSIAGRAVLHTSFRP